jgi:hypothetical protein
MPAVRIWATLILAGLLILGSCNDGDGGQAQSPAGQEAPAAASDAAGPTSADQAPSTPAAWTGDAVNFSFATADGETKTADSYAGKPLVLNFWAAW